MQVAAITGPRQGGLVEVPDPRPQGEFVVVKVRAVPMCTEFKALVRMLHAVGIEVILVEPAAQVAALRPALFTTVTLPSEPGSGDSRHRADDSGTSLRGPA